MANELLNLLQSQLQAVPSELQSGSDRLRPPYGSPLWDAQPVDAGTSRTLETGFNALPLHLQQALLGAPISPITIGTMLPGYNALGVTVPAQKKVPNAAMLSMNSQNMQHELIHELARRLGNPWPKNIEEEYASITGKGESPNPWRDEHSMEGQALKIDQNIQKQYPPASTNWFDWIIQTLFGSPEHKAPLHYFGDRPRA